MKNTDCLLTVVQSSGGKFSASFDKISGLI